MDHDRDLVPTDPFNGSISCGNIISKVTSLSVRVKFRMPLNLFYFFWLCWVFVAAGELALPAVSGGYSSCAARLFTAVASLVVEHGL